jgi:hypothetical protein
MEELYPARQIVLAMFAWLTLGFVAPGVQVGSGSGYGPW